MKKLLLVIVMGTVLLTGCQDKVNDKTEEIIMEEAFGTDNINEIIENQFMKEEGIVTCDVQDIEDGYKLVSVVRDDGLTVTIKFDSDMNVSSYEIK